MRIGVLALQGDFAAHAQAIRAADPAVEIRLVRRRADLEGLDGLVMPGGESTTLLKLLAPEGLDAGIADFVRAGGALLATCAGAILISREVSNPAQPSLGLLDAAVERNSYGRQVDSFVAELTPEPEAAGELGREPLPAVFIRAPRLLRVGPEVEVLARHDGSPVLVRQGRVLAATFHPELTGDGRVHAAFLRAAGRPVAVAATR